jgi:serine/threonine-protein kinase
LSERRPLSELREVDRDPESFLREVGKVFRVFSNQDSSNLCYGVECRGERFFVKTAGRREVGTPRSHAARCEALRRAARRARSLQHRALPQLLEQIETPAGPMLIYEWVEGELLYAPSEQRDARSSLGRFRALPVPRILATLEVIYDVHLALARAGFIAHDFYDGCILYDFERHETHLVDLDEYREGPFENEPGRMLGSTRFMAPEELQCGAPIDQRTNVFTMGRTALVLLGDGTTDASAWRGSAAALDVATQATAEGRDERHADMEIFVAAWRATVRSEPPVRTLE